MSRKVPDGRTWEQLLFSGRKKKESQNVVKNWLLGPFWLVFH